MDTLALSARRLAEQVCRQGDLYPSRAGAPVDPELGVLIQQKVQKKRSATHETYASEVTLQHSLQLAGQDCVLTGRVDGLYNRGEQCVVEEYKCVRGDVLHPNSVDMGQAYVYAGLHAFTQKDLSANLPAAISDSQDKACAPKVTSSACYLVRLVYVDPDSLKETIFEESLQAEQAIAYLAWMLLCMEVRRQRYLNRCDVRVGHCQTLAFPYPEYRTSQRSIARRVYQTVRDRQQLLLEAPTGSGKSVAVIYPALKGLLPEHQVFFSTSRAVGSAAALAALDAVDPEASIFVAVQITAKEQACPFTDVACSADDCPRAAGYFDRLPGALEQACEQGHWSAQRIEQLAEDFELCPFELSLDIASWADLVIGDYNYLFNPQVRLQRFAGHKNLHLLLDEAHQLGPRVQDMLNVEFDRQTLHGVLSAEDSYPRSVVKRVKALDRSVVQLAQGMEMGEHLLSIDALDGLDACVYRFVTTLGEEEIELQEHPALQELNFVCHSWLKSQAWLDGLVWIAQLQVDKLRGGRRAIKVSKQCLDPAPYIAKILSQHGASVRFSGTVTPLPLYQRLHGATEDALAERAQSGFSAEQLGLYIVDDIQTFYRNRSDGIPKLVKLVRDLTASRAGRYLVALPSYAYLQQLREALPQCDDHLFQEPRMDPVSASDFIAAIGERDRCVAFIVMGGLFAESVDYLGTTLHGVVLVGLGLPPPSVQRRASEAHFEAQSGNGWGKLIAYTQPALVKVVQTAGRLLRGPNDRGVVCLVDPRFKLAEVQQFFPSHWVPTVTTSESLYRQLVSFWHQADQPEPKLIDHPAGEI